MTIKELNQLAHEALCAKSTMPAYAVPMPKYNDKSANDLTKCVCAFLTLTGHQAERISNTGRFVKQKGAKDEVFNRNFEHGKYIKGSGTNGTADISSTINVKINGHRVGLSVKWEVKMKDKQSEAQKKYEQQVKDAGGYYYVIHSFDEFYKYFNNLLTLYF